MDSIPIIDHFEEQTAPPGKISYYWLNLISDGLGKPISIPLLVARGMDTGPVLGLTAALHGDELNGIAVIQRLFRHIDPKKLKGTIIGVPVTNVPSYIRGQRRYIDGRDLNRVMPGREGGRDSDIYSYRLMEKLIHQFQYLIDLHTASPGRINSYHIRAAMKSHQVAIIARLQNAQIILNNPGNNTQTLRKAAADRGVIAITAELCDPNIFQNEVIERSLSGIMNTLFYLKMLPGTVIPPSSAAVECAYSMWMYTDEGGILEVLPNVTDFVKQGEIVARLYNIFGHLRREYAAPFDGIVIGKSCQPVNQTGGRILHLGIVGEAS